MVSLLNFAFRIKNLTRCHMPVCHSGLKLEISDRESLASFREV